MRISDWSSDVCSSDLIFPSDEDVSSLGRAAGVAAVFSAAIRCEMAMEALLASPRRLFASSCDIRPRQGSGYQIPAVDQYEENDLERQGNRDGRQHHHAHRHQDCSHHHVDDQEWHEKKERSEENTSKLQS